MNSSGKTVPAGMGADQSPLIIGIGASAGDLEALQ